MSPTSFEAVKRRYNFREISFASWRDPALSVCPAPRAGSDVFPVATYKVKYDFLPPPTDDKDSGFGEEKEDETKIEANATTLEDGEAQDNLVKEGETQPTSAPSPPIDEPLTESPYHKDHDPIPASDDTTAAETQINMVAEEQPAPPKIPSAEVEATPEAGGEDKQPGSKDSAQLDPIEDASEDRKVSFAPGTPEPKPTARKKKSRKKKRKTVISLETVQSDVVADAQRIKGVPPLEGVEGVIEGVQVVEVASSELQSNVETPAIEHAAPQEPPVEPTKEDHVVAAAVVELPAALEQGTLQEPQAEVSKADKAATLGEPSEDTPSDPAAVIYDDTKTTADAPDERGVEDCDDPVTAGIEAPHASNVENRHYESLPPNDGADDSRSPADSGVDIGGTSEDHETADKADQNEAANAGELEEKSGAGSVEDSTPEDGCESNPGKGAVENTEENMDAAIVTEDVAETMVTAETTGDSTESPELTEGEDFDEHDSAEAPLVDAEDEETADIPDAVQEAPSLHDEEIVAEETEQASIADQEDTTAHPPDAPPSPNHSKSSSNKPHKQRADHWERKRKTEDAKVLSRPHDRRRRKRGMNVEDQALPKSNRSTSSGEEHQRRRGERKVERRGVLVAEKRRADRTMEGKAHSQRGHDTRTDTRPRKKTLPSFNLPPLPKALSLSSGPSVHGSTTIRRHSATWSHERPKSSRGREEEAFRLKSASDARPESRRSRSPRRHHHHHRESESKDYRRSRSVQEVEEHRRRRRRSDVEEYSKGRQRKWTLLASLLNL